MKARKLNTGIEIYESNTHNTNRILVRSEKLNDKNYLKLTPIKQILNLLK